MPMLMTDVAQGAKAVTDITESRLAREYAPRRAEAEITALESNAQRNKLQLNEMVRAAAADQEARPQLEALFKSPEFQQLPASEQMKRFASIYATKNPEKAADYINKSSQALDHEAKAQKYAAEAYDKQLNQARQIAISLDVTDPQALAKAKATAPKELMPLIEGASKEWEAAATPEQRAALKDKWQNQFKTLAERQAELKEKELDRKVKDDERKREADNRRFEVQMARLVASVSQRDRSENRKDHEAQTKLVLAYDRGARGMYNKYLNDHNRLLTLYQKAETVQAKNEIKEQMDARREAYEDDVNSWWLTKGVDLGVEKPFAKPTTVEGKAATPESKPSKPEMTAEDQAALAWAKANPNDPRAKKILDLNKGK